MDFLERTRRGCTRKLIHLTIAVMLFLQVGIFTGTASAEAKTQYAHSVPPEDTSPRFLVKEIKISGNTLVSTAELLENLPVVYTVSVQKDEAAAEESYDFRVLHEIILDPGQEREVSKKAIQGLTRYLLSVYQEKGYAGIYVYVPAKAVKGVAELEDGILPIEVLEGRVAKVTIDRYDFDRQKVEKEVLKSSVLKSWSPVKEGQVIRKKELDDFVRLLNLNSDRYVSAVISKGDKPDTLNLGYDVYEANPWHWYVQLDNSGTDKRQWNPRVGVVNTNLTGRDDRFSFMYQAPLDSAEENYLLYGNYEFPFLTPRLRLGFYAGYSGFKITPEIGGGINFRGNGAFYGGTLRYNVLQVKDWFFDFLGSLGHEKSKVIPSLGMEAKVEMDLYGVGGEIHRCDNMSSTSVSFNRFESFNASSEEDFIRARLDTEPDFTIYTLSASHKQFLENSKIHELSGSFSSITSNHRLVPAKMTTFGGLYSVRGYKEDEIVADGGILTSFQYRFDLTKYMEKDTSGDGDKEKQPSYKKKEAWPPDVSLLTFVDYGRATIKAPVPGEEKAQELLGVGLGTAVELGNNAYGAIYYSWPLRVTDNTDKGDGRWNFNFIYRF
jgi:hemolysin activation/secretion protein